MPKLIIEREVPTEQITDFVIHGYTYSWFGTIYHNDGVLTIHHDDPENQEGEWALTTELTDQEFLSKLGWAHASYPKSFCCWEDMTTDNLGLGCAEDLDIALQYAVYGDIIFG